MKLLKKSNKGFTIIEVLLVLVIASSILLIVFLAVPQLQRNARNTKRRSAIASIAGAVNEYAANNNATYPTVLSGIANPYKLCDVTACNKSVEFNLGYYNGITFSTLTSGSEAANTTDSVKLVINGRCNTTTNAADYNSGRSAALLYGIENSASNSYAANCTDI